MPISKEAYFQAASDGNLEVINAYIQENNACSSALNVMNKEKQTAISVCILQKHMDCLKRLIEAGADINAIEKKNEFTPLFHAISIGWVEGVSLLLEKGVNLKQYAKDDLSPCYWLIYTGDNIKLLEILIEAGADINALRYGSSLLDSTISFRRLACFSFLLSLGLKITERDQADFMEYYKKCMTAIDSPEYYGHKRYFYDQSPAQLLSKCDQQKRMYLEASVLQLAYAHEYRAAFELAKKNQEEEKEEKDFSMFKLITHLCAQNPIDLFFIEDCYKSIRDYASLSAQPVTYKALEESIEALEALFGKLVGSDVKSEHYSNNLFIVASMITLYTPDSQKKALWKEEAQQRFNVLKGDAWGKETGLDNIELGPNFQTILSVMQELRTAKERAEKLQLNLSQLHKEVHEKSAEINRLNAQKNADLVTIEALQRIIEAQKRTINKQNVQLKNDTVPQKAHTFF